MLLIDAELSPVGGVTCASAGPSLRSGRGLAGTLVILSTCHVYRQGFAAEARRDRAVLPHGRRTVGPPLPYRLRDCLAAGEALRIERRMEQHARSQARVLRVAPEMRCKVHVAIPGKDRPAG